MIKLILI